VEWMQTPPDGVRDQPGATTWKPLSGGHKVGSAELWGRPTPVGPTRGVLSPGGCLVGPQVAPLCTRVLGAV
jgi:hypothetical protein